VSTRSSRIVAPSRPSSQYWLRAYRLPGASYATVAGHNAEGKSSADEAVEKIQELYVACSIGNNLRHTDLPLQLRDSTR
jgi:hypothetical protein